jgi:YVTN family beta-propeller protein
MVGPRGVVVDSTGERVYVSSQNGGEISVIDAASNAVIKKLSAVGAYGIALSPGGTRLYATNVVDWEVHVFDTNTYAQVARVQVGSTPYGVAVDPTGTRVYVTNYGSNSVTVLDGHTGQVIATVVIGLFPHGVSAHPSNGQIYVANEGSNMVAVLDGRTLSVIRKIAVDDAPRAFGQFVVGPKALQPIEVVEFYNASLDHYFISWMADEIALLDTGIRLKGWTRTGHTFRAYAERLAVTSPVCRYYIPPSFGDSHFFGRGFDECTATGRNNPAFVLEDAAFMHMILPSAGTCPAATTPVYRVFSNRADANHRYMTSAELREQMAAIGWLREGDGPDFVVMCAP